MFKDKTVIIINPKSGTRSRAGLDDTIRRVFGKQGEIIYTQHPGHATLIAQQAAGQGCRRVVAVGGDGTVNETANGLLGTGVPLAIIPFGSGNGLARDLHLPLKRDAALAVAAGGREMDIDCGTLGERHFFCTMGVGFDAFVSQEFANAKRRGFLSYSRIVVHHFLHYKPQKYIITVDGVRHEFTAFIVAVCNAAQYGNNAFIAPHASMADGQLDVTVVERGGIGTLATAGVRLFTHHLDRSHIVHCLRGQNILIERECNGPGHIDGESVDMPAVLDIRCNPAMLRVIVP